MRQITRDAINAFNNHQNFTRDNTMVRADKDTTCLYLHNNIIAVYHHDGNKLFINNCGWETATTKERLNGLLELNNITRRIYQENFEWFICGAGFNWEEKTPFPSNEWVKIEK